MCVCVCVLEIYFRSTALLVGNILLAEKAVLPAAWKVLQIFFYVMDFFVSSLQDVTIALGCDENRCVCLDLR